HKNEKNKYRYTRKGFSFNYEIETDGFAVSLNFINNNEIRNKEKRKTNFKLARSKTNENKKKLTTNELKLFIDRKNNVKNEKEIKQKILVKQKKLQKKQEYKKMSKEEQDEIKNKLNDLSEFPYIEKILSNKERRESFLKDFLEGKIILCDQGKRSPLYLMASNNI